MKKISVPAAIMSGMVFTTNMPISGQIPSVSAVSERAIRDEGLAMQQIQAYAKIEEIIRKRGPEDRVYLEVNDELDFRLPRILEQILDGNEAVSSQDILGRFERALDKARRIENASPRGQVPWFIENFQEDPVASAKAKAFLVLIEENKDDPENALVLIDTFVTQLEKDLDEEKKENYNYWFVIVNIIAVFLATWFLEKTLVGNPRLKSISERIRSLRNGL